MDIKEIIELKKSLKDSISQQIHQFESRTGVIFDSISTERVIIEDRTPSLPIVVKISLVLPEY